MQQLLNDVTSKTIESMQFEIDHLKDVIKQKELDEKKYQRKIQRLENDLKSINSIYEEEVVLRDNIEKERERQYNYNRLLLKTFQNALLVLNMDMNYVIGTDAFIKAEFCLNNNISLAGLPLRYILRRTDKEWAEKIISQCAQTLQSGTDFFYQDRIFDFEGRMTHFTVRISPVFDNFHVVQGAFLYFQDVTEFVRVKEKAEEASRAKGAFLANMSHEIRTPMNAILGMGKLLENTELDKGQKYYVTNMCKASESLLTVINDILDFSKIDAQKMELAHREYQTLELIRDVVGIVALKAAQKDLAFAVETAPSLPVTLFGDDLRLKQIVINLLNNAVKYTRCGSVTLSVGHSSAGDDFSLVVTVADTGVGIRKEKIPSLFTAFEMLDVHRNRNIEGTGLGLAICKGLLQAMAGEIFVESVYGEGSVFTAVIPQKVVNPQSVVTLDAARGKTYLLVGGGTAAQVLCGNLRQINGVEARAVDTVREALGVMEREAVDHVLCWWDAYSAQLRELSNEAGISVVRRSFAEEAEYGDVHTMYEPVLIADVPGLAVQAPAGQDASVAGGDALFETRGATALLVDDNEINLIVASELLKLYGIVSTTAYSGAEALEYAKKKEYDLIFMDHMMPEMDGVETAGLLRQMGGWRARVPIIALTANAIKGMREMFLAHKMDDYLSKPIEMDKVSRVLRRWLPPEKIVDDCSQ